MLQYRRKKLELRVLKLVFVCDAGLRLGMRKTLSTGRTSNN